MREEEQRKQVQEIVRQYTGEVASAHVSVKVQINAVNRKKKWFSMGYMTLPCLKQLYKVKSLKKKLYRSPEYSVFNHLFIASSKKKEKKKQKRWVLVSC